MSVSDRTRGASLVVILIAGVLAVATRAQLASVRRGPYLQRGSDSSIVVRWRTNVASDSLVSYGVCSPGEPLSLTDFQPDSTVTTEHVVTLQGLSPDTRYCYAVGSSSQILAGNDANHFFVTAPALGNSKPTRI